MAAYDITFADIDARPHEAARVPVVLMVGRRSPIRNPPDATNSTVEFCQRVETSVSTYLIVSPSCVGVVEATNVARPARAHAPASTTDIRRAVNPSHAGPTPAPAQRPRALAPACTRATTSVRALRAL